MQTFGCFYVSGLVLPRRLMTQQTWWPVILPSQLFPRYQGSVESFDDDVQKNARLLPELCVFPLLCWWGQPGLALVHIYVWISFTRPFVHPLINQLIKIHPSICPFINISINSCSLVNSCICPVLHLLICPSMYLSIHSFVRSFIQSLCLHFPCSSHLFPARCHKAECRSKFLVALSEFFLADTPSLVFFLFS